MLIINKQNMEHDASEVRSKFMQMHFNSVQISVHIYKSNCTAVRFFQGDNHSYPCQTKISFLRSIFLLFEMQNATHIAKKIGCKPKKSVDEVINQ